FGQTLSRLAVRARLGGAWTLSPREAMSDEPSHCGATRRVRVQHLAQKHPQRDQRRIDSVKPDDVDRCHCLRDDAFRQHVGEWKSAVLQKLTPQKTRLLLKP